MSTSKLPKRASLEFLKKLAKDRLHELRRSDPGARLATALLLVAREHGFSSWRALRAELEQRQAASVAGFFEACANADIEVFRGFLRDEPGLAHATHPNRRHAGWTALHEAAKRGRLDFVRLLLEHGANPDAREAGDNTSPLHWAAAQGHLEVARALLDAGADASGTGDVHALDVIGWATFYDSSGNDPHEIDASRRTLVGLLLERGARHHVFSAIAVGDLDLIRNLVEQNPETLDRRLSRFDHGLTPLHYAISRKRYDILDC